MAYAAFLPKTFLDELKLRTLVEKLDVEEIDSPIFGFNESKLKCFCHKHASFRRMFLCLKFYVKKGIMKSGADRKSPTGIYSWYSSIPGTW